MNSSFLWVLVFVSPLFWLQHYHFFHHPSPEWVNIGIILELYQSGYLICFKTIDLSPIQPILFASQPNIELWYQPGTGHGRGGHD